MAKHFLSDVVFDATVDVPTQSPGDNSTKAASTEFVTTAVAGVSGGGGGGGDWTAGSVTAVGTGLALVDGDLHVDPDVIPSWSDFNASLDDVSTAATTARTTATNLQTLVTPFVRQTGLIIPFYQAVESPLSDSSFADLFEAIRRHPTVPVIVIVNQSGSDGTGGPGPYAAEMEEVIRLLQAAGATVAGYVPTGSGTRDFDAVIADIDSWHSLYSTLSIEAIFLDQMPTDTGDGDVYLSNYNSFYLYAHQHNYKLVVANWGVTAPSVWLDTTVADIYCIYENNSWPSPVTFDIDPLPYTSGSIIDYSVRRFAALIHDSAWDQASFTNLQPYFRWLFATDGTGDNPWATLPTYLETLFLACAAQDQQWRAGLVTSLGSGLSLADGALSATGGSGGDWTAGAVSALGSNLSLTSGTLDATVPVTSVATRTGAVTLTTSDLTDWSSATSAFLTSAPVTSVATRTGAITLTHSDLTDWSSATSSFLTSAPVTSVAGRTGAVTLAVGDVSGAAPLASPTFTGTVTIPSGASISGYAPLASPTFTGTPTVPGYLTTSSAASTYAPLASPTFTGTVTIPSGASISGYAPLASPTFTGTPAAPTAAQNTNTTQLATCAFVLTQAASIVSPMNGTAAVGTSTRYARQDHVHASDTSRAPVASPTFTGSVTIPGGTIDGTTIGSTSASSGAFTTLTATTPSATDSTTNAATTAMVQSRIASTAAISTTGGSTTLTASQYNNAALLVTGTLTSNATLVVPNTGQWTVTNGTSGAFTLTIKTSAGTGVTISQGYANVVLANGTNVVYAHNDLSYGPTIVGGTINNATIGATTAAAATVTTLTATSWIQAGTDTATGFIFANIDGAAGSTRYFQFQTASGNRWSCGCSNDAESSTATGSNFFINAFNNSGTFLYQPLTIARSTGVVTMAQGAAITGGSLDNATVGATTANSGKFTSLQATSAFSLNAPPATITATSYTVGASDTFLIHNSSSGACTVTLPSASSNSGRVIWFKNLSATNPLTSASSNVQPRASGTAGTALLSNGAGNWCMVVSNGTNWVVMAGS
jgi:hypothetical protein